MAAFYERVSEVVEQNIGDCESRICRDVQRRNESDSENRLQNQHEKQKKRRIKKKFYNKVKADIRISYRKTVFLRCNNEKNDIQQSEKNDRKYLEKVKTGKKFLKKSENLSFADHSLFLKPKNSHL